MAVLRPQVVPIETGLEHKELLIIPGGKVPVDVVRGSILEERIGHDDDEYGRGRKGKANKELLRK